MFESGNKGESLDFADIVRVNSGRKLLAPDLPVFEALAVNPKEVVAEVENKPTVP